MDACLFQGSRSAKKFFLDAALPMLRLCLPAAAQCLPASFARLIYFLFISSSRRSQASASTRSCLAIQMSENLSCSKRGGSNTPVAERSNACVKKRFCLPVPSDERFESSTREAAHQPPAGSEPQLLVISGALAGLREERIFADQVP